MCALMKRRNANCLTLSVALEVWGCHHLLDGLSPERKSETWPVTQTIWLPSNQWDVCLRLSSCLLCIHIRMSALATLCFEMKTTLPPLPPYLPPVLIIGYGDGRCQTALSLYKLLRRCRKLLMDDVHFLSCVLDTLGAYDPLLLGYMFLI